MALLAEDVNLQLYFNRSGLKHRQKELIEKEEFMDITSMEQLKVL